MTCPATPAASCAAEIATRTRRRFTGEAYDSERDRHRVVTTLLLTRRKRAGTLLGALPIPLIRSDSHAPIHPTFLEVGRQRRHLDGPDPGRSRLRFGWFER